MTAHEICWYPIRDFHILPIDIEGKDFEVLQPLDLSKYRPSIIIVEAVPSALKLASRKKNPHFADHMQTAGHREYAFTGINSIFVDENLLNRDKKA